MIPLHELLNRIHWDPEFGRGEFKIGYLDHVRGGLVYVPLMEVRQAEDSHFCFDVTDEEGVVHRFRKELRYESKSEKQRDADPNSCCGLP